MTKNINWMWSSAIFALAFYFASVVGVEAAPQMPMSKCYAPFSKLLSDDVFRAHAVRVIHKVVKPASPNVESGKAHLYRTVIREEASLGPNFAGHYTIIRIGCGAATTCLAIADAENGNVYFPPELKTVEALLVDTGAVNVETLNYRWNSSLLVVVGAPDEKQGRAGISYYIWHADVLKLIRFIPAAELCEPEGDG